LGEGVRGFVLTLSLSRDNLGEGVRGFVPTLKINMNLSLILSLDNERELKASSQLREALLTKER
jgi:hypothetical protein